MDFEKTYPGAQILLMEENYRSREPILTRPTALWPAIVIAAPKRYSPRRAQANRCKSSRCAAVPISCRFCLRRAQNCETETAVLFRQPRERPAHHRPVRGAGACPMAEKHRPLRFSPTKSCAGCGGYLCAGHPSRRRRCFSALLLQIWCAGHKGVGAVRLQTRRGKYGLGCWTALLNEDSIRPRIRAAMADVAHGLAPPARMAADDAVRFVADELRLRQIPGQRAWTARNWPCWKCWVPRRTALPTC